MGGRYVYEFKILIFFQCFHMLFMEWQEKWKGGGGDESVTRLQLLKITLKFCKTRTCRSPPLSCSSLALEFWMASGVVLPLQRFAWCPQSGWGAHRCTHMQRSVKQPHCTSASALQPWWALGWQQDGHVLPFQLTQGQHSSSILHGYLRNTVVWWFLVRRKALQEWEKSLLIPPAATTVETVVTRWRLTEFSGL